MVRRGAGLVMVMMLAFVTRPAAAGTVGRRARVPRQVSLGNFINLLMRPTDSNGPALDTVSVPYMLAFTGHNKEALVLVTTPRSD